MYRTILVGLLGVGLMFLTACQSMTGKTAGQSIDDASVTASVQGKLTADRLSNFSRINVDTDRGVVSLNGVVRSAEEQTRADELARQVEGVTKVNNNLQIQSTSIQNP
ncbi:MAG: BON domain-containing protein [Nitrospirae bacterium]|nr:BON domain-containing protein [Nitrospirota bacterium]